VCCRRHRAIRIRWCCWWRCSSGCRGLGPAASDGRHLHNHGEEGRPQVCPAHSSDHRGSGADVVMAWSCGCWRGMLGAKAVVMAWSCCCWRGMLGAKAVVMAWSCCCWRGMLGAKAVPCGCWRGMLGAKAVVQCNLPFQVPLLVVVVEWGWWQSIHGSREESSSVAWKEVLERWKLLIC
jgi:hypothetical protein